MKKMSFYGIIILSVLVTYAIWEVFGPSVSTPVGKYLYINTGSNYTEVKNDLLQKNIISGRFFFDNLSRLSGYEKKIKAGRYEIRDGMSLFNLIRMLKSGKQSAVKLVINKIRTKEEFAKKIGLEFEADSQDVIHFLNSNNIYTEYGLDSSNVITAIIPNTYLINWNSSVKKIFERLLYEQRKFWNEVRIKKASEKNLTPIQVYILASIVEEETNKPTDKLLVASVYINRLRKGMKLEADPTIKYAMRDFGLKRLLFGHLRFSSSYNTYQHSGLPPGPICTPSAETIDAVLDAPDTDFIFFVAKPEFNGYSNFASTYKEHLINAHAYQDALDKLYNIQNK